MSFFHPKILSSSFVYHSHTNKFSLFVFFSVFVLFSVFTLSFSFPVFFSTLVYPIFSHFFLYASIFHPFPSFTNKFSFFVLFPKFLLLFLSRSLSLSLFHHFLFYLIFSSVVTFLSLCLHLSFPSFPYPFPSLLSLSYHSSCFPILHLELPSFSSFLFPWLPSLPPLLDPPFPSLSLPSLTQRSKPLSVPPSPAFPTCPLERGRSCLQGWSVFAPLHRRPLCSCLRSDDVLSSSASTSVVT